MRWFVFLMVISFSIGMSSWAAEEVTRELTQETEDQTAVEEGTTQEDEAQVETETTDEEQTEAASSEEEKTQENVEASQEPEEGAEESQEETLEESIAEEASEVPEEPTEASLLPSFLPPLYVDLSLGASIIQLREEASNASLSVDSTQFKYVGITAGTWLSSMMGAELSIQYQPFNVPVIAIDTRDSSWLSFRLDGRYAFLITENLALSPRVGIGYHQSPYVFVESTTSSFMSAFTQITARGGADAAFQFDPKLLMSLGLYLEYPLTTSIDSPNTLTVYTWKTMIGAQSSALYNFLPWLDAGVQATLLYHSSDVTITRTGATTNNNRLVTQMDINAGLLLRGRF